MNDSATSAYVKTQLINHARLFFTDRAVDALHSDRLQFVTMSEAASIRERCIAIPTDIPPAQKPGDSWSVPCNGTTLILWNRIPPPAGEEWQTIPSDNEPAWYRHRSGTLIPSWNLFGNVFDLLAFGEEARSCERDGHGRFPVVASPRLERGLLDVPAVNEAVALLVDAALACDADRLPSMTTEGSVKAPVIVLSHDCDTLAGNDPWTQAVRLYRCVEPLRRLRVPKVSNLWWIARNALAPHRYFRDNALGMVDIETCFGCVSTFYMLNGTRGRFGARSRLSDVRDLVVQLPASREVGIHYNYDTFMDQDRFASQLDDLSSVCSGSIVSGRAHYLRFDPFRSLRFLAEFGIYVDESSGWSNYVGYRNGIAGCFQAFDTSRGQPVDIWEVPLVVMEDALVAQHGDGAVSRVQRDLFHLSRIGGAYTVLVHPGNFFNPEHPTTIGLYHEILKIGRRFGAVSCTARQLVDRVRKR